MVKDAGAWAWTSYRALPRLAEHQMVAGTVCCRLHSNQQGIAQNQHVIAIKTSTLFTKSVLSQPRANILA